jgi:hypothetical protein
MMTAEGVTLCAARHRAVNPRPPGLAFEPLKGSCGGILYAAAFRFDCRHLGILDHPLSRMMTAESVAHSAAQQRAVVPRLDRGIQGGFNRSSQHFGYGSFGGIRRGFPPVFSSREFSGAWC